MISDGLKRAAAAALLMSGSVFAAGPAQVATVDGALWPHSIETRADFDTASRAELLVSATILDALMRNPPGADELGVRRMDEGSVERWTNLARRQWTVNMKAASATCGEGAVGCGFHGGWAELAAFGNQFADRLEDDPRYRPWLDDTRAFYRTYLKEQLRLAALFPRISSEILTVDSAELTGEQLPDGHFLLTFDDGPTGRSGYTDQYIALLEAEGISATFFSLGTELEKRLKQTSAGELATLYRTQCLGSHGLEHRQHPKWPQWQQTLDRTGHLIRTVFPEQEKIMFRPPYGQRTAEIAAYVHGGDGRVILWNIDSQDWNRKINTAQMSERVKKLMLVRRRGIVLFHDTRAKALSALPDVIRFTKRAQLHWLDCGRIGSF
jgi:peptidoglycan/xylan/chitin deacetylase (PgdA/CDA1 family)